MRIIKEYVELEEYYPEYYFVLPMYHDGEKAISILDAVMKPRPMVKAVYKFDSQVDDNTFRYRFAGMMVEIV